jgi:hypothetical protein
MRDMYVEEVKSPTESKYPFDYFKILATSPTEQAFRPLKTVLFRGARLSREAEVARDIERERVRRTCSPATD